MKVAGPTSGPHDCRQGMELLRHLLKLAGTEPDGGLAWQRFTGLQMFCADHLDIRQIRRLAQTVDHRRSSIIEGLVTGISSGRSEGDNRIVKHISRIAFGFAQPRQPETPDTLRLHPHITPGANHAQALQI